MVARPLERAVGSSNALNQLATTQRRRVGAVALAMVGLIALLRLRGSCETWLSIGSELAVQCAILVSWIAVWRRRMAAGLNVSAHHELIFVGALLVIVPWCLQFVMRLLGQGTGLELIAMSSFAWATLLAALCAQRRRALGTSVVCSGFLTLLATCSSDQAVALLLALVWGGLCLWWLASSTWERAQRCQVSTVIENRWQRPIIVVAGCVVFALSAWSVAGRFPSAGRMPWEIAPTSGGTSWNDEFARSGVGDGDALVAARENAASFGAVDSDLMLESKEASLFDLYSDTFGEPFRKQDTERTVALAPQQPEAAQPASMAQSDGASAALTTQRRSGASHKPMANRASDALLFWIGRPDMHLALERFSNFDGIQWLATELPEVGQPNKLSRALQPTPAGNRTWFSASPIDGGQATAQGGQPATYQGVVPEALKIARLRSPRIPTTAGMQSWHIHQVDDASFFQVDNDDNLTMPGRKSVPEYTIVRYINREIDLQSLTQTIRAPGVTKVDSVDNQTQGQRLAAEAIRRLMDTSATMSPWDRLDHAIQYLRQEFRLDRSVDSSASADPLADFFTQRAGSDLMFATAAACMVRELGYESRLVTGFIARRENRLGWSKELAVYAGDTHAWVEVNTGDGTWIPLEPTPGFPLPIYRVSWRYWLALHVWKIIAAVATSIGAIALAVWQRAWLFDCLCRMLSLVWWLGNDRQRCRWLLKILDWRCRLAGCRRPAHIPPNRWYAKLASVHETAVSQSSTIFFREADRLCFGNQVAMSQAGREAGLALWNRSSCRMLRSVLHPSQTSN